jgi:hypothetical protein
LHGLSVSPTIPADMFKLAPALAVTLSVAAMACDSTKGKADDDKKTAAKVDDKKVDAKKADDKLVEPAPDDGEAKDAADDAKAAEPAKAVALAELSLAPAGLNAKLSAPEGAKAAEEFGAYTVKAGENFQLELRAGATDIAARKKEIAENTVNKLKRYAVESEEELVYETEVMGSAEFHFVANVTLDGAKYACEDTKGKAYTQADIDAMVAACKSLAPLARD